MTDEEKNVNSLKEAYRLWNETKAGTVDHWLGLMTDDVHFRSLAEGAHSMEFTCTSSCKRDVERYFAGLTDAEIGAALDLNERTVRRDWDRARLLLAGMLGR